MFERRHMRSFGRVLAESSMEVGLLFMSLGGWNGKSGFLVEKKIRENFSGGGGVGGRREGRGK